MIKTCSFVSQDGVTGHFSEAVHLKRVIIKRIL